MYHIPLLKYCGLKTIVIYKEYFEDKISSLQYFINFMFITFLF